MNLSRIPANGVWIPIHSPHPCFLRVQSVAIILYLHNRNLPDFIDNECLRDPTATHNHRAGIKGATVDVETQSGRIVEIGRNKFALIFRAREGELIGTRVTILVDDARERITIRGHVEHDGLRRTVGLRESACLANVACNPLGDRFQAKARQAFLVFWCRDRCHDRHDQEHDGELD